MVDLEHSDARSYQFKLVIKEETNCIQQGQKKEFILKIITFKSCNHDSQQEQFHPFIEYNVQP